MSRTRNRSAADGEARRRLIVESALLCIAERGIGRTRVGDIASRAGTSPALVVYHFKTLDAVLSAAFDLAEERFYERLDLVLQEEVDAIGRLRALARLSLGEESGEHYWTTWLELWCESQRTESLMDVRRNVTEHWLEALRSCFLLGQRERVFAQCDVNTVALKLSMLMDGMALTLLGYDRLISSELLIEMWLTAAANELGCPELVPASDMPAHR